MSLDVSVTITAEDDDDDDVVFAFPASDAQRRLWLIHELAPQSAAYNVPLALRLRGKLDPVALARALDELLQRHEVLRTSFGTHEGQLLQIVRPHASMSVSVVDLPDVPEARRDDETRARALCAVQIPFSLSNDLPVRAELLRFSEDDHSLLLTLHHIVVDEWSVGVLLADLGLIYGGLARGSTHALPELPIQYGDFAVWQAERLAHERIAQQAMFWRRELEGAPPILALPLDKVRPSVKSDRGASVHLTVGSAVTARLVELARQERATLFVVLASALDVVLGRHARSHDVVIGSPVAGRRTAEVERLVGFFANMIAIRTELSGNPTFRALVQRVRNTVLRAFANDEVPFETIVEDLHAARTLSHSAIFQVVLGFREAPLAPSVAAGVEIRMLAIDADTARYELTFQINRATTGGLDVTVNYATEVFDAETAQRLGEHLRVVLEVAAEDANRRIEDIDLCGPRDAARLAAWNATRTQYPAEARVDGLFSAAAERSPRAEALSFAGRRMTYAELEARTNRLARHLRRLGVGVETRVGLCAERSIDMIVGMLAVLKAGGAYVPLDPDYPHERLVFMLDDATVPVMLTQEALEGVLPVHSALVVHLDDDSDWSDMSDAPLAPSHDASCLAYVMYTSGSTGRPKGVAVTHRSIVRLLFGTRYALLGPAERIAHASSPSFDASTLEIWGGLLHGGCVVGIDKETLLSPRDLSRALREERVTTMWVTAGLFHQIARERPDTFSTLRCVLFGGQAADPRWVRAVLEAGPPDRLVDGYGPTETTTFATTYEVGPGALETLTVPIGTPIANTTCYALDDRLRPVAFGVPGELFVGGPGLARGYLRRPSMTAERFVPDPFDDAAGARMYRTGDLVRSTSRGFEFLERLDGQIKLRGFRIELGEIENALSSCPGVDHAVAALRETPSGDARLIAYVVTEPGADTFASDLRERVTSVLPEYMVPSAFVFLDALPLTANGKVDRAALPLPESAESASHVPPRTPTERALASIWTEVLDIEPIGALDDFFALGGHSLLATQLVGRLRDAFGVEIAMREVFESPTLEELARRVDEARTEGVGRELPPIERVPRDERGSPLSFAQERLWFLDRLQPWSAYNMPVALRLVGPLDLAALEAALAQLVARHEVLRTRLVETPDGPVQIVDAQVQVPLERIDLGGVPREEREAHAARRVAEDARRPLDLSRAPLLRVEVLRLADDDHVALFVMHHVVSDGWSMGVLVEEMGALYAAALRGEPAPLAELPVQYADYAAWQRRWMAGEELERQLGYWRERLRDAPPMFSIVPDRPRPRVKTGEGQALRCSIPAGLASKVTELCTSDGVSKFMVLLAAFDVLLSRATGQTDVIVGSPVANRRAAELEPLVGFFVNMVALREDLSGEPTFRELLARVRTTCLEAYAHQDLPFEKLVEEISPVRAMNASPVFQICFALQNMPMGTLELGPLTWTQFPFEWSTSKYDIGLFLTETGDGLLGDIEFDSEIFERATIERLAARYVQILGEALDRPDARIDTLELLDVEERRRVLALAQPQAPVPRQETIVALFEAQVDRTSDAVAVVFGDEHLSYSELDGAANRVARRLRELGNAADSCVGVAVDRSVELVVALLATVKAGGAYLALDMDAPDQRLRFLIRDADVRAVVVGPGLRKDVVPADVALVPVCDVVRDATVPAARIASVASPSMLAYLSYTSGSTGVPKGVAVPHRAVVRLVQETTFADLGPSQTYLQLAPIAFDASTFELWAPLLNGGKVAIFSAASLTVQALGRELRDQRVTTLFLTTGLFNAVVEEEPGMLAGLRQLISGGEVVSVPHVRGALGELAHGVFLHAYGPTENTTFTTTHRVEVADLERQTIPIGSPIRETTTYVLDRFLSPVPIGCPGELYTGGEGLARGYLHRPSITAARFVPDPFSREGGARLYATGDQVRWLSDGALEFLGRADQQVKIRGFRIELGEIEATLDAHPGVARSVATVDTTPTGHKRIVAYWVAASAGGRHRIWASPAPAGPPASDLRIAAVKIDADLFEHPAMGPLAWHYVASAFRSARERLPLELAVEGLAEADWLSAPASLGTSTEIVVTRSGPMHGLALWTDGGEPLPGRAIWLPLDEPWTLSAGDRLVVRAAPDHRGLRRLELARSSDASAAVAGGFGRVHEALFGEATFPVRWRGSIRDAELREWMASRLPPYMVPAAFQEIPEIPLGRTGKVDHRALPVPAVNAIEAASEPPRTDAERKLATIWSDVLGRDRIGVTDDFFEIGGNSIAAVQLARRAARAFGTDVPVQSIFQWSTLEAMAARLESAESADPQARPPEARLPADLAPDAELGPSLRFERAPLDRVASPSRILLTGATGFVGGFIARDLVDRTKAEVVCLVRGESDAHASERLRKSLESLGVGDDVLERRVRVVRADLSRPRLGLSEGIWRELEGGVDAIFHCGAFVHFHMPYSELHAPNVGATRELLELAARGAPKAFHHVSTLTVLGGSGLAENEGPDHDVPLAGGYAQTKWVAEKMVHEARARGLTATILRLGLVTGHSTTGAANTRDWWWRLIRGCIEMGSAPDAEVPLDLTPVDFVSAAAVALCTSTQTAGATYHLANPTPIEVREIFEWQRARGWNLELKPWLLWREDARALGAENPIFPLLPLILDDTTVSQAVDSGGGYQTQHTSAMLDALGESCPPSAELLPVYHRYWLDHGVLPPPR